jgi:integrase/recombinase XerD
MTKCNPNNERIKRAYFEYQQEANKKSPSTIDNIRKAISRYELYTKYQGFESFNRHKAIAFKKAFTQAKSSLGEDYLSKATILSTVRHLQDFFKWLSREKGYKRLDVREIEYFNPSENEIRIAHAKKRRLAPSLEQIRAVIKAMPTGNDIELRNRALIAFTLLTGIRDSALASLKLKHIKLDDKLVEQLPPEVKTKFGKTIYTYFFPVGEDIEQIVVDWVNYLYKTKLYNPDNPVFPKTKLILDKNNSFVAGGFEPVCWTTASQIRKIFKEAFINAGMQYFNPHSFRTTLGRLGEILCTTPEEFKAWSQNLGHEHPLTTLISYGYIDEYRQGQIMKNLSKNKNRETVEDQFKEFLKEYKKRDNACLG